MIAVDTNVLVYRGRFVLRDGVLIDEAVGSGRYISRAL